MLYGPIELMVVSILDEGFFSVRVVKKAIDNTTARREVDIKMI